KKESQLYPENRDSSETPSTMETASGRVKKNGAPVVPMVFALTDDWQPAQSEIDYALALGIPDRALKREIVIYRGYWTHGKGRGVRRAAKGWVATWQRWMRKASDNFSERSSGQQQRRRPLV